MFKTSKFQKKMRPFVMMPIFLWIGFVCAISFMEAWLKFRAPNLSLSTGLEVGKIVFLALNKVEWFLSALILACLCFEPKKMIFASVPILILIIQTFSLLPHLSERAELISKGIEISQSHVHFYYIILEIIKVIFLLILGLYEIFRLSISQRKFSHKLVKLS